MYCQWSFRAVVAIFLSFIIVISTSGCSDPIVDEMEGRRVGINTIREPFHKSDQPCGPYPSYYLKYLDDTKCKKRLPSNRDREFQCPVAHSQGLIESVAGYAPVTEAGAAQVDVDTTTLTKILPSEATATVILIRRVDGVPYYRYLGSTGYDQIVETWSSSKFLGVINASESIRYHSDGKVGLDAAIDEFPLGDLATIVHNYDERTFTSNGLMYWFHDVGGRSFANQLIHSRWLGRPDTEVYGANYGAKPPELGFSFTRDEDVVDVTQDLGWIKGNKLSTFTLAEALKRLVMYRENPETRLEFSTWEDIQTLLYGAKNSIWYDDLTPQGMESDTSVYLQEAVDITALDAQTQGQWRIFSKLGLGFTRGGEIVHTDYGCLPALNPEGEPILDRGVEFVISIHLPARENYAGADQQLASLYRDLVAAIQSGAIR